MGSYRYLTTSTLRTYNYPGTMSVGESQTTFAPNNISYADGTNVNEQYGINGSLQRRETNIPGNQPNEELYRFGADGNLRMYSYDRIFYSLYGYDGGTTRTYKYSFDLNPNWVNGRLEAVNFNMHTAMFYPNAYINFNSNGYYTKHYYNGMERIASRLGDQNLSINVNDPELQDRKEWQDSLIRKNVVEITGYEFLPVGYEPDPDDPKPIYELPQVGLNNLIPNTSSIYYYHTNHLGSTCYVTDENASVVQGFLYAPFGEITNEYNNSFGSSVLPKYSFNAKELDEETGFYYYEARYYNPPTFISRDVLFEEKPWFTPYHYCSNNPVVYIDPSGNDEWEINSSGYVIKHIENTEHDAFYMVDEQGNRIEGKTCELTYGTIERHIQRSYEYRGEKDVYDVFQVRGDNNGEKLFKFFANVVADKEIEVSYIKCGIEGDKGLNFVSTAHFKPRTEIQDGVPHRISSEPSQSFLWNGRLRYGYTIREINHSHPYSPNPSKSDLIMSSQIIQIFSNRHAPIPSVNIYYIKGDYYIPY